MGNLAAFFENTINTSQKNSVHLVHINYLFKHREIYQRYMNKSQRKKETNTNCRQVYVVN